MITKKIHYCWFGGNELPDSAKKCIESWHKYLPDYEIIEWNESNYDIKNKCAYVTEAYEAKKWAFVSDYARFDILYQYGGIYFDTDVEVIKDFNEIVLHGNFLGKEIGYKDILEVNPGLGFGCEKRNKLLKEILNYYSKIHFDINNPITICTHVTDILTKYGYIGKNDVENILDFTIYPTEYFCPLNYYNGDLNITDNTRSIHRYTASWYSARIQMFKKIERKFVKKYGLKVRKKVVFRIYKNIYCYGLWNTLKKILGVNNENK